MEKLNLSYSEFPAKSDLTMYGVETLEMLQIYNFFKNNAQDRLYVIELPEDVFYSSIFYSSKQNLYESYGIFAKEHNGNLHLREKQWYLLILSEEDVSSFDSLKASYKKQLARLPEGASFEHCIIEKFFDESTDLNIVYDIVEVIKSIDSNIKILNKIFRQRRVSYNSNELTRYLQIVSPNTNKSYLNLVDLSPEFLSHNLLAMDFNTKLLNCSKILDDIMLRFSTDNITTVYHLDESKLPSVGAKEYRTAFSVIAAYLTLAHKKRFILSDRTYVDFREACFKLIGRTYNYLSDYLRLISTPIDVSFYLTNRRGYACSLDKKSLINEQGKRNYSKYGITLSVCYAEFDLDSKEISSKESIMSRVSLNYIDVLDIADVFGVNSKDFDEAAEGFGELNDCIAKFERKLRKESTVLKMSAINCNNVLIFKLRGVCYLGYVPSVDGVYPYWVYPLTKGYPQFSHEFTITEMSQFLSPNVIIDGVRIVAALRQNDANCYYNLPSYARGVLITAIAPSLETFKEGCGFSFEEIGLWANQSSEFRQGKERFSLEMMSASSCRDNNYLTYFGGVHPAISTKIVITPESWRGSNV